jgi:glutathione synthase/RimK-type ligase-like ATP-grasp enzyme
MAHPHRVALLWRDSPEARGNLGFGRFEGTAAALAAAGMVPEPCIYAEEVEEPAEAQLRDVAAVLVWVNPIHEGRDRARLDAMLRRVADHGVLVSAHPDAILAMGTKEVLYRTRALPWGGDVRCYRSPDELSRELPASLATGVRVLKQNRGHSGLGVWRVEAAGDLVRVRHAQRGSPIETMPLSDFLARCRTYFDHGGLMIDQPFVPRLAEGMIRCYLIGTRIEGFGHQAVNALFPPPPGAADDAMPPPGPRLYSGPDDARFQRLRGLMEREWLPPFLDLVGMTPASLPVLWDIDFMLGPRDAEGQDSYVLCEINVSSVSPFPDSAPAPLAQEVRRRLG